MAKRVLSLLLALVMALSLCVPAFAAEGTDAAAEGEADEPATIALEEPAPIALATPAPGEKQSAIDEAVAKLKASVATVAEYKTHLENGDWTVDRPSGEDPAAARDELYKRLDAAQTLLDKIANAADSVTLTQIQAQQTALNIYVKEGELLYGKIGPDASTWDKTQLTTAISALPCSIVSYASFQGEYVQKVLKQTYQPDFIEELGAAIQAADALKAEKHPTHVAYAELTETLKALAGNGEKAKKAALPTEADAKELLAKIEELEAIKADQTANHTYTTESYGASEANIDSLVDTGTAFKSPTDKWGIKAGTSLWNLKGFIESADAAIKKLETNEALLYIAGVTMADDYKSITLKLASNDKNDDGKGDENMYVVTATLTGGNEMCGGTKFDATAPGAGQLASALVGTTPNITLANLLTDATALKGHGDKFLDGDVVTLQVYMISGGKAVAVGDPYVYTVNGEYNGPMIEKAEFQTSGSIAVTLTKALNTTYPNGELVVKDASGAVVVDKTAITSSNGTSVTLNFKTGVTAAVGTYTVELSVKATAAESEAGTTMTLRDTKTFAVANITNYKAADPIKDADVAKADTLAKKVALANGKTGYDILVYLTDLLSDYEDYVGKGANVTC